MTRLSGAHLLIATLKRAGVDRIFGLCGDHVNAIFNACLDQGLSVIDTRHESAATHMADAWARVTGRPGVSVVTGGPGHTNSITGLATAWHVGSPILAISGQFSTQLRGKGASQEMDQVGLIRGITKWAAEVTNPAQIPAMTARAMQEAISGRPGPVHLSIPVDVATAEVGQATIPDVQRLPPPPAKQADIRAAMDVLTRGARPVLIAGSGVFWARAWDLLQRFVEMTFIPGFTVGAARGSLSDDHPLGFGYADPLLNPTAEEIRRADVVLVLGKRIDFRLEYGGLFDPAATLIQVDIHPAELGRGREIQVPILADARDALEQLLIEAGRHPWKELPWVHELRQRRRTAWDQWEAEEHSEATPMHPLRLIREVRERLDPESIIAIDGGDFAQWARLGLPARSPGHWLRLGPLGTVGAAIPFGIAAQLAKPASRVVVLTGDGGFAMHGWEIHTALRHHAPIIVVIGNDQGWGMERELQAAFYGRTIGTELGLVRYDRVVETLGGYGEYVERPSELGPALDRAFKAGRPACINVLMRGVASALTRANIERYKS